MHDLTKVRCYEAHIDTPRLFFEVLNAVALYHFQRVAVDFAVIEVGAQGHVSWYYAKCLGYTD